MSELESMTFAELRTHVEAMTPEELEADQDLWRLPKCRCGAGMRSLYPVDHNSGTTEIVAACPEPGKGHQQIVQTTPRHAIEQPGCCNICEVEGRW